MNIGKSEMDYVINFIGKITRNSVRKCINELVEEAVWGRIWDVAGGRVHTSIVISTYRPISNKIKHDNR